MAAERPARSAPRRGAAAYGVAYMASENPSSKENNTLWQHTTKHTHVTEEGGAGPPLRGGGVSAGALRTHFPGRREGTKIRRAARKESRKRETNKMKREKRKVQHPAFPRGPPPQYCPGSTPLNFAVRMGSGEPG